MYRVSVQYVYSVNEVVYHLTATQAHLMGPPIFSRLKVYGCKNDCESKEGLNISVREWTLLREAEENAAPQDIKVGDKLLNYSRAQSPCLQGIYTCLIDDATSFFAA